MENIINKKTNSTKQIKRGAVMSYLAIFFNIAVGLTYTPWMVKLIGQSEYGLYSLALTLIGFFTIDFGLGEAVSRFLSRYIAENDSSKVKDFLGITFKIYIFIDIILFIVLTFVYVFAQNIYAQLTAEELSKFRIVFCIAALYSVASFPFTPLNGILISNERFSFMKFTDLFNKILTVSTMIIVLLLGFRLYSLIIVNVAVGSITLILKINYLYKNNLIKINFKFSDKIMLKSIFNFSVWSAIIGVASRFILNITPTILAAFSGTQQISLFYIAMTIEGYTWTFANALNGLFLPKITRIITKNENLNEIENLMIKVGRIQLILIGIIIIGFLSMGKEFMVLWMGADYIDSYYITMLLISPCLVTLTQQIGNTTLVALNEIKYRSFCYIFVAALSVTLSLIFSQIWGAIGSGIAIFIGNTLGLVIGMNIVYCKVLKINIFYFFKECHMKMGIPLLLMTCIGFLMQYLFPVNSLILFAVKLCLFSLLYFLLMFNLALRKEEKLLFKGLFDTGFSVLRRKLHV